MGRRKRSGDTSDTPSAGDQGHSPELNLQNDDKPEVVRGDGFTMSSPSERADAPAEASTTKASVEGVAAVPAPPEGDEAPKRPGPWGSPQTANAELGAPTSEASPATPHPAFSRMRALRFVRGRHSLVFFAYALIGTVLLVAVKAAVQHLSYAIALYFVAVLGVLGSYFVLNMTNLAGLRLRYDQLGDNLYYLGFIYTLGTLTYTLYVFQVDVSNIFEIISSFGIALTSTILGVVGRICAHMMRLDPHEVEDAVRSDLLDLTSRVRAALDVVVRDMTIFGDQTRQVLTELQNDVAQNIGEKVTALTALSDKVLKAVDTSFEVSNANSARVNELGTQTVAALKGLVSRIEAVDAPSNLIEEKLLPATDQIERVVALMAEVSGRELERADSLKLVTDSMASAIQSVQEHIALISAATSQEVIAERTTVAAEALRDMTEQVTRLRDHMKALVQSETEAVTGLRNEYANAVAVVRTQGESIKVELDRFRRLTSDTQDALVDLARAMKAAL